MAFMSIQERYTTKQEIVVNYFSEGVLVTYAQGPDSI